MVMFFSETQCTTTNPDSDNVWMLSLE